MNFNMKKLILLLVVITVCEKSFAQDEIFFSGFEPIPLLHLDASPESIAIGESTTLTWSVIDADSCVKSGHWVGLATAGTGIHSEVVTPNMFPAMYSMQCSNQYGDTPVRTVVIQNSSIVGLPHLTFLSPPFTTIPPGGSVVIHALITDAVFCDKFGDWSGTINGHVGTLSYTEQVTNIQSNSVFSLQCFNGFGSTPIKSVMVSVVSMPTCNNSLPPANTLRDTQYLTFQDAVGSEFGLPSGGTAEYALTNNTYSALEFTTPAGETNGTIQFAPFSTYYRSDITTVSISTCPGDFYASLPDGICQILLFSGNGILHWSTTQSLPPFDCPLEPNTVYYLNIIHADPNNLSTSSCFNSSQAGCGVGFRQW